MKTNFFRRKNYIINPKFQLSFLSYMLSIAAATLAIFLAAKFIFFAKLTSALTANGFTTDNVIFDLINQQSRTMDLIFLTAGGVELLLMAVAGILLSHKVSGPLYRLYHDMLRNADGAEAKPVKFRKGDYFQELADAYNKQLDRFKK